LNSLQ